MYLITATFSYYRNQESFTSGVVCLLIVFTWGQYCGEALAQEVESIGWLPQGCCFLPRLLLAERCGVAERDPLTLFIPDEMAVALRG